MSFDIVLQRNTSPSNKLSKDLVTVTTVTGVLREGASILDPVILLDVSVPSNVVSTANYCYISEFSRYYFITDVRTTVNGLWELSLHVDVLMSWKTEIKAQSGIINRSQNKYNLYLDDGWFVDYQNPHIVTKVFPNDRAFEHQEYVLVLAGNNGYNGGGGGGTEQQITDVSTFTKEYSNSIPFGNYGSKVSSLLDVTNETTIANLMSGGWDASGAAYYDSEMQIGAYGGYTFPSGDNRNITKVKLWLGRYSGQNETLKVTLQYRFDALTWIDIQELSISTNLNYPVNVFEVPLTTGQVKGIRWIHRDTPQKSPNNNVCFFGMTLYETI